MGADGKPRQLLSMDIKSLVMATRDPVSISLVPRECAHLKDYTAPPTSIPANVPFVAAFPFTVATEAKAAEVLSNILGPGNTGGPALIDALVSFKVGEAVSDTHPYKGAPTLVAAGWMRDPEAVQSLSTGTLWVALAVNQPIGSTSANRLLRRIAENAGKAAGFVVNKAGSPAIQTLLIAVATATGPSDEQLQGAAVASAIGFAKFGTFVRMTLGGAASRITRDSNAKVRDFENRGLAVQEAVQTIAGIAAIEQGVEQVVSVALNMPREQVTQAAQMLALVKVDLRRKKQRLMLGIESAQYIRDKASVATTEVAAEIRQEILSDAEAEIARGTPIGIMREYQRCAYLSFADRNLRTYLTRAETALANAQQAADTLLAAGEQASQVAAVLDQLVARVEWAEQQLPLSALQRTYFGLPGWGWAAIGGVVIVGGVAVAAKVKKRHRAAAASTAVVKNRRRYRRLA
jgi:hypothetical protein